MGRNANMLLMGFPARDRPPFLWPAVAATLLHPPFWVMLLGNDPKRGFAGFGGLRALRAFAGIGSIAAILPTLGRAFASQSVFAVMALGGVFAWLPWACFVGFVVMAGPAEWHALSPMGRVTGLVLTVQLLLWPLCFALVYRVATGGARRR